MGDPNADLAKKKKFLESFTTRKVVATTLDAIGVDRKTFNAWVKDDREFKSQLDELEERIDDEALVIAYQETGILKSRSRRRKIDRTLLRDVLRRHPRFKSADERKDAPAPAPIGIRGISPTILLQVIGGNVQVSATADGSEAIPPVAEIQALEPPTEDKPRIQHPAPTFTPEQVREIKRSVGLKCMGPEITAEGNA